MIPDAGRASSSPYAGREASSCPASFRVWFQETCALSRMPNAPTIFATVSKLGLPFGESAL